MTVSIDPPMSFRGRHRLLDDAYDRHLDPEQISAKELGFLSRQVGLCMEEVHAWFEDESNRRTKLLVKFKGQDSIDPRPYSPESMSSHAPSQSICTTRAEINESSQLDTEFYPKFESTFSGPSSPGTVSGDYLQVPTRARRGRPAKPDSSSPPQPKRQKTSCQYPCFDCGKTFPADRWSEHVKRVHFPDSIWECQKTNERTGKPCSANPFYRTDNFTTHLRGEHRCEEPEISRLKITCKFAVVEFFHKVCGVCSRDLITRDESIEHTKEHLREICCRSNVPVDLGLSEWKERCGVEHKLKRGVHYQVDKEKVKDANDQGKDSDGDPDNNSNDDQTRPGSDESGNSSYQGRGDYSFGGFDYNQHFNFESYKGPDGLQDVETLSFGARDSSISSPSFAAHPYICTPSPYSYASSYPYAPPRAPNEYNYEREEASEKGRCTYPECGKVFKDLKAHMLTHRNERPEKCPIQTCDYHIKGFARKYDKNRHTLTHYRGTMVCGFCPGCGSAAEKSFNRADVFKRHLTSVHGVEQTPPNSRKKSTSAGMLSSQKKLYGYAPDATGKCSTCSAIFSNAQEFYEHLDDCVLRIIQQEEPSEAVNAAMLARIEKDSHETIRSNQLPATTAQLVHTSQDDVDEDEDEEDEEDEEEDGNDEDFSPSKGRSSRKRSVNPANSVQKSRGLTHSKGGVNLDSSRRKRKDYPSSWGCPTSQMKLKKRVLNTFDGPRRLWKDDMMLDSDYEARIKLSTEKVYVTDLDIHTMRRADEFHASTAVERGPFIADELTDMDLEKLVEVSQE